MFLINTPSHKRWMLPDGKHFFNAVIYGDEISITVWNVARNECVVRVPPIKIEGDWERNVELCQYFAEKRYAKRTPAQEYARSYRK